VPVLSVRAAIKRWPMSPDRQGVRSA